MAALLIVLTIGAIAASGNDWDGRAICQNLSNLARQLRAEQVSARRSRVPMDQHLSEIRSVLEMAKRVAPAMVRAIFEDRLTFEDFRDRMADQGILLPTTYMKPAYLDLFLSRHCPEYRLSPIQDPRPLIAPEEESIPGPSNPGPGDNVRDRETQSIPVL